METEIRRGVLAPFGHGPWTAITGGALLARRPPDGRFRFTGAAVGTCPGAARPDGTGLDGRLFAREHLPHPTDQQQHRFTLVPVGLPVFVSLPGVTRVRPLAWRDPSLRNTP
ncbi:hypothetical protein [Streptomyces griseorubiginosus]|uniref:hypothetical protein n=1 Tax=Streptomyces griseorubiginosus TaxID=67304 RepID=UPI0036657517